MTTEQQVLLNIDIIQHKETYKHYVKISTDGLTITITGPFESEEAALSYAAHMRNEILKDIQGEIVYDFGQNPKGH